MSEWLKVMLGEVARKKEEREAALEEQRSRDDEQARLGDHPKHDKPDEANTNK